MNETSVKITQDFTRPSLIKVSLCGKPLEFALGPLRPIPDWVCVPFCGAGWVLGAVVCLLLLSADRMESRALWGSQSYFRAASFSVESGTESPSTVLIWSKHEYKRPARAHTHTSSCVNVCSTNSHLHIMAENENTHSRRYAFVNRNISRVDASLVLQLLQRPPLQLKLPVNFFLSFTLLAQLNRELTLQH